MISPPQSVEQLLDAAPQTSPADRAALPNCACQNSPGIRQLDEQRPLAEGDRGGPALDRADPPTATRSGPPPGTSLLANGVRFAPGQVIAERFTVIRYIARGGMGEVYEVEDRLLQGVHVALKMILPEIAGDAGSSHRFEQEVLLARKVVHPNLCPIYDIARSNDPPPPFLFLTMKLLTGETLSSRLRQPGLISREEAIALFRQMVAGLAAIHAGGVIHRDIKPNNVMLDHSGPELCLSIMDFGLARLHEADETMATGSLVAGTPGYMAPEILRGQGPSQATDLFALGVVLHQVLAGERPHISPVNLSVEPSAALDKADVPPAYIRAVKQFLSNDPRRRCAAFEQIQSSIAPVTRYPAFDTANGIIVWIQHRFRRFAAGVVSVALLLASLLFIPAVGERVRGILFSSEEKHIAVLPLETSGGTPQTQAIGDGLMDSLAGRLSNLDTASNSLWVVPASEMRRRKVTDPSAALREFGATIVIEGSFQRGQDSTRLKLTLVDTKKMREIGFAELESKNDNLATLQDDAMIRLGRLLNIPIREDLSSRNERPVSRAADEDYLLALGYAQRFDRPGNLDLAVTALQNALKTDPHFALGFARLAQVYVMKYRLDKSPGWLEQAEQYSKKALQLDPRVPLAHIALGQVEQYTGHHDVAAHEFQRAVDLDPRDPEALSGLAASDRFLGHNREAEAAYIRAADLRSSDWSGYNNLGLFYSRIGRPLDAIAQFRRAINLAPDNSGVYANLGAAYLNAGDPQMVAQAEQAFNKSIAIKPTYWAYANLANLYGSQHRFGDSVAAINQALKLNDQDYEVWNNLAEGYEWQGDEKNSAIARKRARALVERTIQLNPQNANAQATLSVLLAKDELRSEALEKIQISLALAPDSQSVLSDVAGAYELLGNRRLAILYLNKSLAHGLSAAELNTDPYVKNVILDPHFTLPKSQSGK